MHRGVWTLVVGLALVGCGDVGGAAQDASREALEGAALEGARAMVVSIPAALAARGPSAWLDFFEDSRSFFMASDGAMAFDGPDAARSFLADFAARVEGMSLSWREPRFEVLGDGVVAVTAAYEERIAMTDGTESAFGGRVSGVVRLGEGGWRFQHLHWSSPVAAPEGEG